MKTIWVFGGYSNMNVGDSALQSAITHIVKERSKHDIQFRYFDTQNTLVTPDLISIMNREADLLLLGGGGFVFRSINPNNVSGWQFNIKTEDIKKINVPIALYGIGYNRFPYDTEPLNLSVWNNIEEFFKKSSVVSVRNRGTLRDLKEHGLTVDKISVAPDAGMFVKAQEFNHSIFDNQNIKIGLNWATDRMLERFKSFDDYDASLNLVFSVCDKIIRQYNAKVYLIEHLMIKNQTHKNVKDNLKNRIRGKAGFHIVSEEIPYLYPPFEYYAGFFANIYKKMDMVMGMRGHSLIIPFGQNVPVVGLGQHNKVKYFLEDCDMSSMHVKLNEGYHDEWPLLSKAYSVLDSHESIEKISSTFAKLEQTKNNEIDKILSLL